MKSLSRLIKRSSRFQPKDISRLSGLSPQYIVELRQGTKTNPSLSAYEKFDRAVTALERTAAKKREALTKKKTSTKTDKKQTQSRDAKRASVAKTSH